MSPKKGPQQKGFLKKNRHERTSLNIKSPKKKLPREVEIFSVFLSINSNRRLYTHQKMSNGFPTLKHSPNYGKRMCENLFSGKFFHEDLFFQRTFFAGLFAGTIFPATIFPRAVFPEIFVPENLFSGTFLPEIFFRDSYMLITIEGSHAITR